MSQVFFMASDDYLKIRRVVKHCKKYIKTLRKLECNFLINHDLGNFIYIIRKLIKMN